MNGFVNIPEAASLAFHGMGLLAAGGQRMNVREMAEVTGASEAHLAKVFQRLLKAGLVSSERGPRGGYELARDPAEISLLDIYTAIEGAPQTGGFCLIHAEKCPFGHCLFGDLPGQMNQALAKHLARTALNGLRKGDGHDEF